jgi:hypothetical protein
VGAQGRFPAVFLPISTFCLHLEGSA